MELCVRRSKNISELKGCGVLRYWRRRWIQNGRPMATAPARNQGARNPTYFFSFGRVSTNCGADAHVRAGPPGPASGEKPAWAPAAVLGDRPTANIVTVSPFGSGNIRAWHHPAAGPWGEVDSRYRRRWPSS